MRYVLSMNTDRMRATAPPWILASAFFVLAAALLVPVATAQSSADDNEKAMKYSLYYEDFKNENYASALPNLQWILENAPTYPKNDDRNFERAAQTYAGLAEQAEDETQKQAYLDSALVVYDTAVPRLKEAGADVDEYSWALQKGRFIQENSSAFPDSRDQVAGLYREAYDLKPEEIDSYYIDYLLRSYLPDEKEKAMALMEDVEAKRSGEEKIDELLAEMGNRVFTSPQERLTYLEKQVEGGSDDPEKMAELFQLYMNAGQKQKASQLGQRLRNAENPSPSVLRALAQMALEDGNAQEAFSMYEEASSMNGAEPAAQDFYNMALAQQQMGNPRQARTYFQRAIDTSADFGPAYVGIGDLYVSAVSNCTGEEMAIEDRAVYWLATDWYQQAKSADPSISGQADQKISTYRQYFPNQEALFFKGWEAGQSYNVDGGCYSWIGESTTVKSPS